MVANHMDLSQVTLTQMRYAVAVGTTRNFRLAAAQCHVSQSGLSMQISRLEELLDTPLFDRSKKPVLITVQGEAALEQMRTVLRETERLGQMLIEHPEPSGPFRLGIIPTLSSTLTPLFLLNFITEYPKVDLVIEELKTADIVTGLLSDSLDAGLVAIPLDEPGLTETSLAFEGMFAYLPPGDPLLRRASLTPSELTQRALWLLPDGHCFRNQILAFCGREPPPSPAPVHFESGSFETLIRLVDRGVGATVLPALVAANLSASRRRKQLKPLSNPIPLREIGLVTARTELRAHISSALAAVLREVLADSLQEPPKRSVVLEP